MFPSYYTMSFWGYKVLAELLSLIVTLHQLVAELLPVGVLFFFLNSLLFYLLSKSSKTYLD